ncbi:MAG: aldehyde dehydrogenase family protein [Dongiaceae bacterium]
MNMLIPDYPMPAGPAAAFVKKTHQLLIDGKWVGAKSGKTFDVVNPATGLRLSSVAEAEAADVDAAVKAARRAFDDGPWSRMTGAERAKLIWRLADAIDGITDELATINSLENGKPINDSRKGEVPFTAECFRYMAGWCTKVGGETINISAPGSWHAYTLREPVGVAAQIIPWNFPLAMAAWKLGPALAAGCTIVLKPAEQTPRGVLRIGQLFEEVGFPPGVVNIITGFGETAGAAMASHDDVDKVAFTGSTEVGKLIVKAATGNLKKVSLELGGKSPTIILADADLDTAIAGASSAIFFNMGQCCTAGSRLFVHERIYDKLVGGVAESASRLKVGNGLDPATEIGPLVSSEQLDRVTRLIGEGKSDGVEVLTGGERIGDRGYFVQPTVIANTSPEMSVIREEIFGPVVCAIPFADDDLDAIARQANDTSYGLAASVWTQNLSAAHKLAKRIRAGTIWINTHNFNDCALPFGGYKQSGWGRELGRESLDLYTQVKAVAARLA